MTDQCWCEACMPNDMYNMRMIVCETCGNKRCPHATNHINACTGSNEPGQKGSSWENYKVPGVEDNDDFDYFDEDGYPTDEALEYLANMSYTKKDGFKGVMEMAENLWSSYGKFDIKEDKSKYYYRLVTGGWSGNESVIWALKDNRNFFWAMCWVSSTRGGLHEFEVAKYDDNGMPIKGDV